MTARLSQPIESLMKDAPPGTVFATVDVAIVGSGYGGSVAAACLAGPDRRVVILERGREYALGDFPVGLGQVPGHVQFQRADADEAIGYPDALFDFRIGKTMDVLVGSGLGGTSLINANVAVRPVDDDFRDAAWPHQIRTDPGVLHPWFKEASDLLGVPPENAKDRPGVQPVDTPKTDKHRALSVLAKRLGATCEPASLAVTFAGSDGHRTATGQPPCTLCGNCVTGCNVGAKNTLMMNALPRAKARGAELFTGASVLSVMPSGDERHPWIIRLRRTASEKTPLQDEVFHLKARDVILAAGTLGSTEILKRSRDRDRLRVSGELGKNFSGNGDAIAFGFARKQPVHAIGKPDQHGGPYEVGPTITGIVRTGVLDQDRKWQKLTIEDAALPTSLRRLFGELLTTAAFLQRFDDPALPDWYRTKNADPITVAPEAIEHSQVFLAMGDDGAKGTLELRPAKGKSLDHAHLVVEWDDVGNNPALRAAHDLFKKHDRGPGLDGGQYVPNPFWRVFPEGAGAVMSGPPPGGRAITVHPLGGCGMGDSVRTGVVNHLGQVFDDVEDGDGTELHDGLHVLDGSIVPKALGTNPLLTIAALSWRAADALCQTRGWAASEARERPLDLEVVKPLPAAPRSPKSEAIHLVLRERLIGTVTSVPGWLNDFDHRTKRWTEDKGLVLSLEMDIPDLEGWLEGRAPRARPTQAKLYVNRLPAEATRRLHRVHTPDEDLNEGTRIAQGRGEVLLFQADEVRWLTRLWRTVLALHAYSRRRQSLGSWLFGARKRRRQQVPPSPGRRPAPPAGFLKQIRGFWRVAWQHALYRRLHYRLQFESGEKSFTLEGEKRLAWRLDAPRLWDALLNLQFTLTPASGAEAIGGTLEVDTTYLVTTGTPQVKSSPHLPATIVALSRLGMLFGRMLLQTHFWEFGAPKYPDEPIPRPAGPLPLKVGDKRLDPEIVDLWVPLYEGGDSVRLQLTRYRQEKRGAEAVLLIHGLAQGSLIYSTDTLEPNMAAAMWKAGYDVWLLDYRISNMLPDPVPEGGWSMDEIGRYDIATAVEHVYTACGDRPVRIFAHCVGATSLAMAILKGWLKVAGTDTNRVKCVAFNAIHPWTMPSTVNEFRARLGSFFRDVVRQDMLDPVPRPQPSSAQVLLDRLAFSVARYAEEGGDHRRTRDTEDPATVCDRMTFLYGRMWRHANLDPRTHAELPRLMGAGAGDVYRQLYYFALHERLTDNEGQNTYLTDANIRANWRDIPTFFFHGEESMVFNPASAERSAIRLDAILNHDRKDRRTPVRLLRVPGFGHMDVVFGKDAHEKVYGTLQKFFDTPSDQEPLGDPLDPRHDVDPRRGFRLTAGPVLRAAWVDDDKSVRVRLWAETTDEVISLVDGVRLLTQNVIQVEEHWTVDPDEPRYRMLDACLNEQGPVKLRVRPKVGPAMMQTANSEDEAEDIDDLFYEDTTPWLNRLRAADVSTPCRDMRFLVGSCRYPGTPFESAASDAIFKGMLPHIEGSADALPGVHMLFLIGDQIYADATANILDSRAGRERYGQKYRDAFTSENARSVLARLPTHFAIDDHEIADAWSGENPESPLFQQAMRSAKVFLSSGRKHRPVDREQKRLSDHLWYSLSQRQEHCCPTFVMDTRSEREPRVHAKGPGAQFATLDQFSALADWLTAMNREPWANMPKFIMCGVGIAPISRDFAGFGTTWRSHDGWPGYPLALARILSKILHDQIQHVVFVSGDLHLSSASKLTLRHKDIEVTAWQVVASGLYAPMPFAGAQPTSYDWNRSVPLPSVHLPKDAGCDVDVEAHSGLLYMGGPHFLRLDAERKGDGWTVSIGAVGPAKNGAFLAPVGTPPSGFVEDGPRWTAHLAGRPETIAR